MNVILRQELRADHSKVPKVIQEAFKTLPQSDQTEHLLVERLRQSNAFIPELSIVAAAGNEIVGHILFTKIKVRGESEVAESLALAPVSVKPNYQRKSIGSSLIKEGHRIGKDLGFESVILIGHAQYYPRFGYERASKYGIELPFDAPDENCMVVRLAENALTGVKGLVEYPKEFYM